MTDKCDIVSALQAGALCASTSEGGPLGRYDAMKKIWSYPPSSSIGRID